MIGILMLKMHRWRTRDRLVLHKVKHHYSDHHPGQESSQSHQQLRGHFQLPEEAQTFGLDGDRLWWSCSTGPTGCGGGGGGGSSFVWKKRAKRYFSHSGDIIHAVMLSTTFADSSSARLEQAETLLVIYSIFVMFTLKDRTRFHWKQITNEQWHAGIYMNLFSVLFQPYTFISWGCTFF